MSVSSKKVRAAKRRALARLGQLERADPPRGFDGWLEKMKLNDFLPPPYGQTHFFGLDRGVPTNVEPGDSPEPRPLEEALVEGMRLLLLRGGHL